MIFAHTIHFMPIRRIIYSFHMPVFFIISGYFYSNKSIKEQIRKDFISLMIPYFITCLFVTILNVIVNKNNVIVDIVVSIFGITEGNNFTNNISVGPIWFLMNLFLSKLLFQIISKIKKEKLKLIIILTLNMIGVLISKFKYLPFNFDVVLVSLIYLYIGKMIRDKELLNYKLKFYHIIALVTIWIIGIIIGEFNFIARSYPKYPVCIITSIIGSYSFIMICKYLDTQKYFVIFKRILKFWGNNSLYMLCIHRIEKDFIKYENLINTNIDNLNKIIIFFIKILIISLCTEIILLIIKYIKKLRKT